MDAILTSIDNFASADGGAFRFSPSFSQVHFNKAMEFMGIAPALGRAFDLEVISCERMVSILIPPFSKLAQAHVVAARRKISKERLWFKLLCPLSYAWSTMVAETLTGQVYEDSQGVIQPVIGPKRRSELLGGFLEAKFPEVRSLANWKRELVSWERKLVFLARLGA